MTTVPEAGLAVAVTLSVAALSAEGRAAGRSGPPAFAADNLSRGLLCAEEPQSDAICGVNWDGEANADAA
jgi:hypothetical protein